MVTIHKSFINGIDFEKSIKRPWWDITALWRGRYVTLTVTLPDNASKDCYFSDIN